MKAKRARGNIHKPPKFAKGAQKKRPNHMPATLLSPIQQERIIQKFAAGKSKSQIAKEEGRNRHTVLHVLQLNPGRVEEYLKEMRLRFFDMTAESVTTVRKAIVDGNADMAYMHLRDVGVAPRQGAATQPPIFSVNFGEANKPAITTELVNKLPQKDQIKFRLLEMAEGRADAFGYDPNTIEFPKAEVAGEKTPVESKTQIRTVS